MAHEEHRDEKLRAQIGSGFYYSDSNQMQGFEPSSDLFNLQSGIDMLGILRDRNNIAWKGFNSKSSNSNQASTSKTVAEASTDFYQPDFGFSEPPNENLIIAPDSAWQENRLMVDDSSLRCVFPRDGNERQIHGLSLSLCPNKVSNGGLQSFELRESNSQNDMRFVSLNSEDGFFGKSMDFHQQQQNNLLEGRSYQSAMGFSQQMHHQQLKNSRYLLPTRELLNEFCSAGTKQKDNNSRGGSKNKFHKTNQWEEGDSSKNQSLYSFDLLELQKRKAKLVSMLEEVDRRYRHYCEQMRSVVSSFEGVAGVGAASVYSSLALKAMSRHFRCLRDAIVGQIQVTKKAMGEKEPSARGGTKGETPRLKLLDQTLRQQRAIQQMGMESHPWRPQRGLPERSVSVLRAWLFEHFLHPYPTDVDKHILSRQTGLSRSQVSNWFINARVRLWKPMVEEMYLEEAKEQDNKASDGVTDQDNSRPNPQHPNQNPSPNPNHNNQLHHDDRKPSPDRLVHDPESLSSIINNSDVRDQKYGKGHAPQHQSQFGRAETFGFVDLDFSAYGHANSDCDHPSFGNGVSLTLGLQQHSGGGVSLAFSPASQHSLFFSRQHMEECPPIQYSILDGETQTLPYRPIGT